MDRRNFLRSMLGVAAVTALPSEVFPFRKIFLPALSRIYQVSYEFVTRNGFVTTPSPLAEIQACELEALAKEIPDLIYREDSFFRLLKQREALSISSQAFRIPLPEPLVAGKFIWTPNEDQAKAIADKYTEGVDVQAAIDAL